MSDYDVFADDPTPEDQAVAKAAAIEAEKDAEYRRLKHAYAALFDAGLPEALVVMDDLMKFCRLFETTDSPVGHPQAWDMKTLEGRRQVALRILEFSRLSSEVLFSRYHRR